MASIPWLADTLRGAGVRVVEEGDWRNRGTRGSFDPIGVLWHHTAFRSSPSNPAPALGTCINGRPDLRGPLCHALVDYNGVFHVISANRANHAGVSGGSGPIPAGDGNTMLIGWEIDYEGNPDVANPQHMTAAQYSASVTATAAVLRRLGRDASYARGHRETSITGKIDPSFIDLDKMRADVARVGPGSTRYENLAVYRKSASKFIIRAADGSVLTEVRFGDTAKGDVPIVGHFENTQYDNLGVYRVSTGTFIIRAADGTILAEVPWGDTAKGDVPIVGHFENTQYDNLGVYRVSTGTFIIRAADGTILAEVPWGDTAKGDVPIVGHFENTQYDNLGVYRMSTGTFIIRAADGSVLTEVRFGDTAKGDVPVKGYFQ